jgi:probable rRNA maturation factor
MTDGARGGLRVVLVDGLGRPARVAGLADWLRALVPARVRGLVTIALVDDATMRRLNRRHLGKNRSTDVLSFPAGERGAAAFARSASAPKKTPRHTDRAPRHAAGAARSGPALGDIAIAVDVARRQARDAGHSYAQELRVLALHGLLHLLGYDHESDGGAMARLEARLRRRGGLQSGVIERAEHA